MPNANTGVSRNVHGSMLRTIRASLGFLLAASLACPIFAAAEDFPLREKYAAVGIQPVGTKALVASLNEMSVVDARSVYEYETLRIQGARSIPWASSDFNQAVRNLAKESGKTQRAGASLFQMRDRHVPLTTDNRELSGLVARASAEKRPMFFVDATGKQIRWLQYYLEEQGLDNYWFLQGGALAIFEGMGAP